MFYKLAFFQGICSAYDIIVLCKVDVLELIGLRKKAHRNGNGGGKSQVKFGISVIDRN